MLFFKSFIYNILEYLINPKTKVGKDDKSSYSFGTNVCVWEGAFLSNLVRFPSCLFTKRWSFRIYEFYMAVSLVCRGKVNIVVAQTLLIIILNTSLTQPFRVHSRIAFLVIGINLSVPKLDTSYFSVNEIYGELLLAVLCAK